MAALSFHITGGRIEEMTLDMQAAIEELADGIYHPRAWRDIFILFAVDAENQPLPPEVARQEIGALKGAALRDAASAFGKAFSEYALPKGKSNRSSSPSTIAEPPPAG